jgi:tape measure domain-containing protein
VAQSEGIEFLLELNAKLDDATKMMRALRGVTDTVKKTDDSLKKAETRVSLFGRLFTNSADQARKSWERFTERVAALGAWDVLKFGLATLRDAGKWIAHLGVEMVLAAAGAERTELAFTNMLGADKGRATLDYLEELSHHTEFTGDALKTMSQDFIDAGFSTDELKWALAATTDAAARATNKVAGAAEAAGVLQRVKLGGGVDARGLRRLGISAPDFFKQMAKDLGVSQKALQKQLQEGKVKTDNILNSIYKAMQKKSGKELGAVGEQMATTLSARLEKLKAVKEDLFQDLFHTEGYQQLSDILGNLAIDLGPNGRIGSKITAALGQVFGQVGDVLKTADWEKLSDTLIHLFQALPPLLNAVVKIVEGVGWFGKLVGETAAKVYLSTGVSSGQTDDEYMAGIKRGLKGPRAAAPPPTAGPKDFVAEARAARMGKRGLAAAAAAPGTWQGDVQWDAVSGTTVPRGTPTTTMKPPSESARPPGPWRPGPVNVSAPIHVNVEGSNASPEEIAKQIKLVVPSSIAAALEQIALQGGM